ncbi:hypothetical protein FRC97_00205 (plasmid) [Paracidovorax citrulli]|uniref:hypothetical protein n=1 Tax=Paracidovorax citrulli TaxID=80869 RepID=UPI000A84DB5B|nr:hypothetical protein [Paracidovorax citrulli]QCX13183.1 hypothetical protein APS58_p00039 [Paracidovorax citrulli]UMT93558.1 hypothetical protein FRC97_00205 [Paracidovorax citrulli]
MQANQFIEDIPAAIAMRAFQGTSFSQEKRATAYRSDYAETMAADYLEFKAQAKMGGTLDKLQEVFERYRQGYANRYRSWLNSHSRCISWMITGPSNFPTRRAEKWNNAAHNRMAEAINYRERVKRAILRELRPDLRPIMSGDADAIQRLALKVAGMEREQYVMKQANAAIRKHAKAGAEAQILALAELGLSRATAEKLLGGDYAGRIGFPAYALTNNNANIRRARERLEQLELMHARPKTEMEGEGVKMEEDSPANRIRLYFDQKPDAGLRQKLTKGGFRWTPSLGAWQAYINNRTRELAQSIVKGDSDVIVP